MQLLASVRFHGRKPAFTRPAPSVSLGLAAHVAAPAKSCELTSEQRELVETILQRAGIDVHDYRVEPFRRRMGALLRSVRKASAAAALSTLRSTPRLSETALNSLLIGYTTAFRDVEVFRTVRDSVVPVLPEGPLRIWSIGCSRGFELLSVAALLAHAGRLQSCELRGTDCRPCGWDQDRTLVRDFLEDVPEPFQELCQQVPVEQLEAAVRRIHWRTENMFDCHENGQWDMILCRNVSIYLQPAASERLWTMIAAALKPGGFLIAGKAERPALAKLKRLSPCIYQSEA